MVYCSACGAAMSEGANFCAKCGKVASAPGEAVSATSRAGAATAPAPEAGVSSAPAGPLPDNMAGLLAYITIVPAIVFLLLEPYRSNKNLRFHAFQSVFLYSAYVGVLLLYDWVLFPVGLHRTLSTGSAALALFFSWLWNLLSLGVLVMAIVCAVHAHRGGRYKLPLLGDLAEKEAG